MVEWPDMKEADCVRPFAIAFSKGFDSVSQAIIFNKLKEVSINPYIICWIIFFFLEDFRDLYLMVLCLRSGP